MAIYSLQKTKMTGKNADSLALIKSQAKHLGVLVKEKKKNVMIILVP